MCPWVAGVAGSVMQELGQAEIRMQSAPRSLRGLAPAGEGTVGRAAAVCVPPVSSLTA